SGFVLHDEHVDRDAFACVALTGARVALARSAAVGRRPARRGAARDDGAETAGITRSAPARRVPVARTIVPATPASSSNGHGSHRADCSRQNRAPHTSPLPEIAVPAERQRPALDVSELSSLSRLSPPDR